MKQKEQHGMTNTPEYRSWAMMLSRCRDSNNPAFQYYGGRGITFDPEWENFSSFLSDMGRRPSATSIERVDTNGDYCKDNCRWADDSDQGQNKRKINGNNDYTGAQFSQGKWRSYITKDRRQYGLGQYSVEIDAVLAYDIAATALYPDGKLNFPMNKPIYMAILSIFNFSAADFKNKPNRIAYGAVRAVKKMLGQSTKDVQEAIDSLDRWKEMQAEDAKS